MHRADDARLARRLAAALDGRAEPTGELAALVSVLEAAAAQARIDVGGDETERALAAARPAPAARRAHRRVPVLVLAIGLAVAAAALVLAWPFGGAATRDVQAQALAALGGRGSVLEVTERIVQGRAGGSAVSTRTGWIDPSRGLAGWTQRTAAGRVVDETLVRRGAITRYDPATRSAVLAVSCRGLATGCAPAVDPVAVYRQALLRVAATSARTVSFRGRSAYRFSLPVTRLADATRIVQVVTLDAHTLLPERIEWLTSAASGGGHAIAVIDVTAVTVLRRDLAPADAFTLPLPRGTAITQVAPSGQPVRLVSVSRITAAQARVLRPTLLWLGDRDGRFPLTSISRYRYTGGDAVLMRYGPLRVWNYGPVIPPALLGDLAVPVKQFPVGPRTARLYATTGGAFAVETDRPGGTVAIVAPVRRSGAALGALAHLRPITRGSPG
jgi:hypothetical protein